MQRQHTTYSPSLHSWNFRTKELNIGPDMQGLRSLSYSELCPLARIKSPDTPMQVMLRKSR